MSEHLKEESLIPYLDGRLSAAVRETLGAHLSVCAECRERVDELRALLGALAEWTLEPPSPTFDAALRARLAEEAEQGSGWLVLRPVYGAALAVAVVIASAVALWPPTTVEAPPLPQPPGVALAPLPTQPSTTAPSQPTQPKGNGTDALAVLDNSVLLENYDMLTQFDILFESAAEEKKGKTL